MFIEDGEPLVIYGVHRIRRGKRARYRTPKRDFFCIGYRLSGCADFYLADGNCRHVAEHNAVLIGNAHGHYKKPPKLDIERVKAIRKATGNIPLVLHGGSGIPDDQVKAAINAGIRKLNIGTDVCCAFAEGAKAELDNPTRSLAVDLFMKPSIESVKKLALNKIALTGALGKA